MNDTLAITEARPGDHYLVEGLLDLSFGTDRRTKSSYRLREGNRAISGLSLVVRDEKVGLAGTISFWPVKIGADGQDALLLGPLAVHPRRQGLGIGLALMHAGLARAKAEGHPLIILVGDAPYYAKVGFQKVPHGRIIMPGPTDPDRILFLELTPHAFDGVAGEVRSPQQFASLPAFAPPHGAEAQEQHAQA
ncbi:GNAT family N-acetyltransferase [Aestuariivirga sp.]|uniref:GNAT family N-acetyltransferase n=1 Tax=Aestuariivirga sp. TaxID=2650926 RepID=UPI0039E52766